MIGRMSPPSRLLAAKAAHPGAAALGGPREIVADEQRDMAARRVRHLPGADVGVIESAGPSARWNVSPKSRVGRVERGLDHPVELEVGLDRGLVEIVARLSHLVGVVAASRCGDAMFRPRTGQRLAARRAPPRARARAIGQTGSSRPRTAPAASSPCWRRACRRRRRDSRAACARSTRSFSVSATIARLSVLPPVSPRCVQAAKARLAQVAVRVENCRKGSISERDSVMTCWPGSPRSSATRAAAASSQSGSPARSSSVSSTSVVAGLVGQHVLAELGAERRQPLDDLRQARLLVRTEAARPSERSACASGRGRGVALRRAAVSEPAAWSASMRANSAPFMPMSL